MGPVKPPLEKLPCFQFYRWLGMSLLGRPRKQDILGTLRRENSPKSIGATHNSLKQGLGVSSQPQESLPVQSETLCQKFQQSKL